MSIYRLPILEERKDGDKVVLSAKQAIRHVDNVAALLTCLAVEAERNQLTSMSIVLIELANSLCEDSDRFGTLVRSVERRQEEVERQQKDKDKKNE